MIARARGTVGPEVEPVVEFAVHLVDGSTAFPAAYFLRQAALHEAIGYVTPNDEHEGRGDAIRKARRAGLNRADRKRRIWHRKNRNQP